MTKQEELMLLTNKLWDFLVASRELTTALEEISEIDINLYIQDQYPFSESFDDLMLKIRAWYEVSRESIRNAYKNEN